MKRVEKEQNHTIMTTKSIMNETIGEIFGGLMYNFGNSLSNAGSWFMKVGDSWGYHPNQTNHHNHDDHHQ